LVAIVLPGTESFSPEAAGAISLLVHRQALAASRYHSVVVGAPVARPFTDAPFQPAPQAWLPLPAGQRHAAGVRRVVRQRRPALVEVHNRPDLARALTGLGASVTLVLHNDPLGMRGWRGDWPGQVVAVSAWLAGRTGRADVAVLPNCIDLSAIPAEPAAREAKILFVGRIVADKGADAFVEACRLALPALPGWHAEMIGADRFGADTPETAFLRALRPRAAAAGVALAGWRPHAEVLSAMARAAIVVVPSRWPEPFGMTALEAAACRAAVAYAPRGGLPEVLGDAGLVIDPDDPPGMAAALVALAGDPPRRAALAAAGRARAARFDVGPAMTRLDDLRDAVLATGSRRTLI
jgi:glycosyltransferase involved in cell wall biosynthesis